MTPQTLAARLTDKRLQDQTSLHIVEALVKADRAGEASPFAGRIGDATLQSAAKAMIVAPSAKNESIGILQARIEKAASREEKLALCDTLFAKQLDLADIAAAEATIGAMVKTIQAFPRESEKSKFGEFDDAVALAVVQSNYLAVAEALAKKGDREGSLLRLAQARKSVAGLPEQAGLAKAILARKLVTTEVSLGDFDGARASLQHSGFSKSALAGQVAAGLIKSGDVKSGLEVAELITEPRSKGLATGQVASELLRVGETTAAKTLLGKLSDSAEDVLAFMEAGSVLATLGRETELQQWLDEITSNAARVYLCIGAAESLRSDGAKAR